MVDITIYIFKKIYVVYKIGGKLQCDYYNNTVHSKKVRCWPINSSLKDAKLLKTQNFVFYWYQTFLGKAKYFFVWNFAYNTQETFLWHKLLLCDLPGISSLLLPRFAVTCNHKSKI